MTDWLWEKRECSEQKDIYEKYYKYKFRNKHMSSEEHDRRYVQKIRRVSVTLLWHGVGQGECHITIACVRYGECHITVACVRDGECHITIA